MNQTRFEFTVPDALALLSLAAFVCENENALRLVNEEQMDMGRFQVLVADFKIKANEANKVLKRLDEDEAISPLLSLPRDGIRWRDRE